MEDASNGGDESDNENSRGSSSREESNRAVAHGSPNHRFHKALTVYSDDETSEKYMRCDSKEYDEERRKMLREIEVCF